MGGGGGGYLTEKSFSRQLFMQLSIFTTTYIHVKFKAIEAVTKKTFIKNKKQIENAPN